MVPERPDMTSEEERRARLLEECEIPDLLASALDRHPDAWNVLWAQREFARMDAAEETIDPTKIEVALDSLARSDRAPIDRRLRFRLRIIRTHLSCLESCGCEFDFKSARVTVPHSGGRPPSLYRGLVEALRGELGPKLSRKEKIAQIDRLSFRNPLGRIDDG